MCRHSFTEKGSISFLLQAVDGAHSQGNNINSLATFCSPMMPLLVSGCKGGFVKLWNPETCSNIGNDLCGIYLHAHQAKFRKLWGGWLVPCSPSQNVLSLVNRLSCLCVFLTGELLAHKHSINSVATNNTCIFTGSRLVQGSLVWNVFSDHWSDHWSDHMPYGSCWCRLVYSLC